MKKTLALILAMILALSVLSGYSSATTATPSTTGEGNSTPTTEGTSGAEEMNAPVEVKKVILTYATAGVEPTDMQMVQDKINEMTIRDIGVEIEFLPISIFELASTVPTKVLSGEQIDIFMMAFTGTKLYENMNMLLPIGEYINEDVMPYTYAHPGADGVYDDKAETVYSVHLPVTEATTGGFLISKADLDAAGLGDKYHDYDKITLDDLDEIFAAIKAACPDKYPCGIIGSATRADQTFIWDALGDSVNSGALIGLDSTTVENYYASEPYKNYLTHVRDWYLKGYIPRDAATTDISLSDYLSQGIISGYFNSFKDSSLKNSLGTDFVYLQLMEYYRQSLAPSTYIYFGIPVTAGEPEAAARFIDYMLSNADVANTFTFGVEGVHWVVDDEEHGTITYPEGVTRETTGYSYGYGFYLNRSLDGVYLGFGAYDPTILTDAEGMARAAGRETMGFGAAYDSSEWTMQLQQIDTVVAQYKASLETGSADLDKVYPEFLAALDANGMQDVIAAKQAWFDEWLAK